MGQGGLFPETPNPAAGSWTIQPQDEEQVAAAWSEAALAAISVFLLNKA